MTEPPQDLIHEGVRFFGEISASISHELKNVLAIINENAGLLADIVDLSTKGMPIAPQRLARLAQSIAGQVSRGDRIVKDMNRFAHSADLPRETVDVGDVIHFICEVASRLIKKKGELPRIDTPAVPIMVQTNRFFLENLVWACLNHSLDAQTPDREMAVEVKKSHNGARIRFRGLSTDAASTVHPFPSPREKTVAGLLNARLMTDRQHGEIVIILDRNAII
jgi:C4-dicarboxylate-specific signal transduction histidine kinase